MMLYLVKVLALVAATNAAAQPELGKVHAKLTICLNALNKVMSDVNLPTIDNFEVAVTNHDTAVNLLSVCEQFKDDIKFKVVLIL